jgi:HKD family nuclease
MVTSGIGKRWASPNGKWKAHLVSNSGPNTLLSQLNAGLRQAHRADIAVAFVSLSGLASVLPKLRMLANRGGVRLVTGLYQDVTQPAALRKLLQVTGEGGGLFFVRISRNRSFHPKLYLLKSSTRTRAFIGSSNLSDGGLLSDGELDLFISLPTGAPPAKQLAEHFDLIWSKTVPLTKGLIDRYSARYEFLRKHGKPKGLPSLSGILKLDDARDIHRKDPVRPPRWWRDSISGLLEPKTELIIRRETDWESKGWEWHCPGQHKFEPGDVILLLDFADHWAYIAKVTAKTECPTPDGRYFVAWRRQTRFRRRKMTDAFWKEMRAQGVATAKTFAKNPRRLLGGPLQDAVAALFRKNQ